MPAWRLRSREELIMPRAHEVSFVLVVVSVAMMCVASTAAAQSTKKSEARAGYYSQWFDRSAGIEVASSYYVTGQTQSSHRTGANSPSITTTAPPPLFYDGCVTTPRYGEARRGRDGRAIVIGDGDGNCIFYASLPSVAPDEDDPARPRRPSPEALARRAFDRAIALAPRPALAQTPWIKGLTGLETYFWLEREPRPITATAAAGPLSVTAEAYPIEYRWDFGDGTTTSTTSPGKPYQSESSPGDVAHVYETKGYYDIGVTVIWEARWRVSGGPWRPLGYFSNSDTREDFPVRGLIAALVRSRR